MTKTIPKQVLQGLKSIADETLEQGGDEVKKAVGISTQKPVDLMPDIQNMGVKEQKQAEEIDSQETQAQAEQIRQGLGRNVGGEIKQIREQKENEEEKKERLLLENLKKQRQAEAEERNRLVGEQQTPVHRKKKSRGSAFKKGKPKSDEMSATGEFSRKKD